MSIEQEIINLRNEIHKHTHLYYVEDSPIISDYEFDKLLKQLVDLENLTIPHPRMHLRAFVLIPLQEIRADYIHPVTKKPIISLINDLPDEQEISRLLG